jgi:chemosensory pili system protein ChpA (sensor histidine kinase/response regulator)
MDRNVEPEVVAGFVVEARSYVPKIREGLDAFRANPTQVDLLEEAYRHSHCIKGAASMVGLSDLSHLACQLEEALEEVTLGELAPTDAVLSLFHATVAAMQAYLDGGGTPRADQPSLAALTESYQRLRGPARAHGDAGVEAMLRRSAAGPAGACAEPRLPAARRASPDPGPRKAPSDAAPSPTPGSVGEASGEPFCGLSPEDLPPGLDLPPFLAGQGEAQQDLAAPPITDLPFPAAPDPASHIVLEPANEQDAGEETPPPTAEEPSPELLEVFATEAEDHLRTIGKMLPALERQPGDKECLQEIRRSAHTLKGSAALVGLHQLTQLAHRMEDLLDQLYEGGRAVTPDAIQLLYASAGALEDLAAGKPVGGSLTEIYGRYKALLGAAAPAGLEEEPSAAKAPRPEGALPEAGEAAASKTPATQTREAAASPLKPAQFLRVPLERLDELVKLFSELIISRTAFEQRLADLARQVEELRLSNERMRRVAGKLETEYEVSALGGGRLAAVPDPAGRVNRLAPLTTTTHDFDELEFDRYTEFHLLSRELSESATDLQTVGNELGNLVSEFDGYVNRQARLSSEIQDKLMRVRMVPLATLANRLDRAVRTVAQVQGKQVELRLDGEDTYLDKSVLEEMADPLLHLLRNAVDHGIEAPAVRAQRGKPARGTIRVRAFQEGTQVVIQSSDDGAGVDPGAVRAVAVAKGFVTSADAERMTDGELLSLIFLPGFSTAREVSEVSGRGVGLDIVKARVHKLKGTLAVDSQPGRGTTFTIRLPTSLAIMRALLVRAHHQTLAVPLDAVSQILRINREDIERVGGDSVIRLDGRVYPQVSLGKALHFKQPAEEPSPRPPALIVSAEDKQVVLVVDELIGGREVVLKNLGSHVRRLHGVLGATLMGDGRVVLIVNPADLLREPARARAPERRPPEPLGTRDRESLTVMVVDDSPSVRRVVSTLVRNAGWQAVTAKDGLDAMEILGRSAAPPDVVLVDVEMPRMDGYELVATLKGQEAYRHLPVVFITSRAGQKHRRKALDLGASAYVTKPYQDAALLKLIRELAREPSRTVSV